MAWQIDPRIASPYWDLTEDVVQAGTLGSSAWTESVLFADDWFGSMTRGSLHTSGSKWFADVIRPKDETYAERSSYGFTTMTWNNDDSPWVTRADRMCDYPKTNWDVQGMNPDCAAVDSVMGASSLWDLMAATTIHYHQVHFPMGGVFDCAHSFKEVITAAEADSSGWYDEHGAMLDNLVESLFYLYMDWNNAGLLEKPESCTAGVDAFDDCRVLRKGWRELGASGDKAALVAGIGDLFRAGDQASNIMFTNANRAELPKALAKVSVETLRMLGDTLFRLGKGGSMYEYFLVEPFFWSIHENLERFYAHAALHSGSRDGSVVKASVDTSLTAGEEDARHTYAPSKFKWEWAADDETIALCNGHNLEDVLSMPLETGTRPFNDEAFGLTGLDHPGAYTNEELLHLFWPTNVENPYVYDTLLFKECGDSVEYKPHSSR